MAACISVNGRIVDTNVPPKTSREIPAENWRRSGTMEMLERQTRPAPSGPAPPRESRWARLLTLNQNLSGSYLMAVVGAEYMLKMLPMSCGTPNSSSHPSSLVIT